MSEQKRFPWTHYLPLVLMATMFLGASQQTALAQRDAHILAKRKTVVLPERFLRSYDPITVVFNRDKGPKSGGPLDRPEGVIDLTPRHPGEYRWLDARTLQFLPTTPWPALTSFKISVGKQQHRLVTLMASPRSTTPSAGSRDLDPIEDITLHFSHPIDPNQLADMISLQVKPMPGLDDEPGRRLTSRDFTIKTIERRSLSDKASYLLVLARPVTFGHTVRLHLRLSTDDTSGKSFVHYQYTTKPPFRVTGLGSGNTLYPVSNSGSIYSREQAVDGGSGQAMIRVRFSDQPAAISLEQARAMVSFEPAVREFRHQLSGKYLHVYFDAARDLTYKVSLQHVDLTDRAERRLAPFGPTSAFLYFTRSVSYLRWRQSQGIMERYGPQSFPLEGRDIERVDLRVYKIDPLERNFWPFPQQVPLVNEQQRPAGPGEEPEPHTNLREHIRQLGTPLSSRITALEPRADGRQKSFGLDLADTFGRISGKQEPGTYLVGYRLLGEGASRQYVRVQVTDLALSTIEEAQGVTFAVTSVKTGQPVAGARIVVETLYRGEVHEFINAVTDDQGFFHYRHHQAAKGHPFRIRVNKDQDYLVLDPNNPPPSYTNNFFRSGGTWLRWISQSFHERKHVSTLLCHIYPERPVYRPDEPVHLRGYARTRLDGRLQAPHLALASLQVVGPGNKRWLYPLEIDALGNFYHMFEESDLPTGDYQVYLLDENNNRYGEAGFKKEAYRIPRFEIALTGPDITPLDKPFKLTLTADYYAGGRVVDQEVTWRVATSPYRWNPPHWPDYLFSSDERFSGGGNDGFDDGGTHRAQTDQHGSAELSLDPTQDSSAQPRRYQVEATVRGADEQTVSTTKSVLALPPFIVGLKLPRLVRDDAPLKPSILILDNEGNPLAGKELQVRVFHRQWHSYLVESDFTTGKAKYVTDVVDEPLVNETLISTSEPLTREYPVDEAGVYVVEVLARDALGRLQQVRTDLFAAGDEPVAWQKPKQQIFEATWDKKAYDPGDEAALIIKSPFQKARALVITETPEANLYQWLDVKGGKAIHTLKITAQMAPRLPVHVLLMRGRVKGESEGKADLGKPVTQAATSWLQVRPKGFQAKVTLKHAAKCLPGDQVPLEIEVLDPDGQPLDGEVTLWLVDRAVLALGKEARLDPLPLFMRDHPSLVQLYDTRNTLLGELPTELFPGGDGSKPGEGLFGKVTVRKNFQPVPYYKAGIPVRAGKARVSLPMPDNLTDFAVRALATSGTERFGVARSMISVRLPLIVQSALPRFVRPGDRFNAGGIGRVVEGEGGPGRVEIQVEGLTIDGPSAKDLSWAPNQPQQLYFPMTVTREAAADDKETHKVRLTMAVKRNGDGASDAFELQLPIRRDRDWAFHETFVQTTRNEAVSLPNPEGKVRPGTLDREILLTQEPAAVKMLAALNYLDGYPHGCTEQRISRLMPRLALKEVMGMLGRSVDGQTDLAVAETLRYLETTFGGNGLFSFWPGSSGYVYLTAYVVEFLVVAKANGYQINEKMLNRALVSLEQALRSDYRNFIRGHHYTERATALAALSSAGKFDPTYAFELAARAQNMRLSSEADMLHVLLREQISQGTLVDDLADDLEKSVIYALRDGREVYQGLQYRANTRTGPIMGSEVTTLASMTRALHRKAPDDARNRKLMDTLIELGEGDGWGDTYSNAAALKALADMLSLDGEAPPIDFRMTVGGQHSEIGTKGQLITRFSSNQEGSGRFRYLEGEGPMPLAWIRMRYLSADPGDTVTTQNAGFVISRELEQFFPGEPTPLKTEITPGVVVKVPMGTLLEEHVRVVNPEDRYFVAVRVPFAAGLEPMNPNLATAPKEATPRGSLTLSPSYALFEDDQVTFYYDHLPKGTFHFYFRLKAMIQGSFTHPAARAELMYQQTTFGRGAGSRILVEARP